MRSSSAEGISIASFAATNMNVGDAVFVLERRRKGDRMRATPRRQAGIIGRKSQIAASFRGGGPIASIPHETGRANRFFDEALTRLLAQWSQHRRTGVGVLDSRRISPRW